MQGSDLQDLAVVLEYTKLHYTISDLEVCGLTVVGMAKS